jgi:mRNA interferase RelE/StbE
MTWKVQIEESAKADMSRLGRQVAIRILKFLHERVANLEDPRSIGDALKGSRLGDFWRYRVGDYRLICKIEDAEIEVVVVKVGHRSKVYR